MKPCMVSRLSMLQQLLAVLNVAALFIPSSGLAVRSPHALGRASGASRNDTAANPILAGNETSSHQSFVQSLRLDDGVAWRNWSKEVNTLRTYLMQQEASGGFAQALDVDHTDSQAAVPQHSEVLFVIYSDSLFYGTRLQWIKDTWAHNVPGGHSNLVIVADRLPTAEENLLDMDVHGTKCPEHSHWEGACCKYAEAVILAHTKMQSNPALQWAYFTDDDAYVRPDALAAALLAQREPGAAALGNFGCGTDGCPIGLCAGGGYAGSRSAIAAMVGASPSQFLAEQMQSCSKCGSWADVALSQVMLQRGVRWQEQSGLYGWKLPKAEFDASLAAATGTNTSVEPLMYHYIRTKSQMQFLHDLFSTEKLALGTAASTGEVTQSQAIGTIGSLTQIGGVQPPQLPDASCATFHDNTQCIGS
eukprot:CAMPEP_0178436722 /NCGR_PEP_ID=MMETSP0689_2-20121128/34588_1 /TAXON_ID=160604 /ORGANISM="Amphidinium massartii, Strain CS-259" /LENGTH=417 /DNA_ID=CAMNT_0020058831 /DNA_START=29 /DNA_END=1278 /DNA_ORIENTATION=+